MPRALKSGFGEAGTGTPRKSSGDHAARRRLPGFWAAIFAAALYLAPSAYAKTALPPPPTQWVTDDAGFLSESAVRRYNSQLRAYEQQTGHQVIVWIGTTLGDEPIEDWAATTFKAWRIGRKRLDDGLAIFIFAQDRKIRIEVGYGLEGVVTDAQAARVIAQMVPRIRAGDRDGAVGVAIRSITSAIGGGEGITDRGRGQVREPSGQPQVIEISPLKAIFFGVLVLLVLGFLITHPRLALFLLMSSGRRGGWGGGGGGGDGGGFSGGGGSSGGGGATGSW